MIDQLLLDYIKTNAKRLFGNQFWEARFLYNVDVGPKVDKLERRILIISKFRIFFLAGKATTKLHVENTYPLLSVTEITQPSSGNGNELSITLEGRRLLLRLIDENITSHDLAIKLLTSFKHYYEHCDIHKFLDLSPGSLYTTYANLPSAKPSLPCGGFRRTYASLCDYYKQNYRDEIVWDVERIYSLHSDKVLRLDDFSHLSMKDLIPLVATLQFNPWFNGVLSENLKLSNELLDVICLALKKSTRIKEMTFKNGSFRCDFLHALTQALSSNPNLPLEKLHLSGHTFDENRTFLNFVTALSNFSSTLHSINFDDCCLSSKSVNAFFEKFNETFQTMKQRTGQLTIGIKSLSVVNNQLRDDIPELNKFFTYNKFLTNLNLSGTTLQADKIWAALKFSCLSLETLNLSSCSFSQRKTAKDLNLLSPIKDFFSSAKHLKFLTLSDCILPAEVLKYILLGLVCNQDCEDIVMNLSRSFGDRQCISHLETCAPDLTTVSALILQDCALEVDAGPLLSGLSQMKRLRLLDLGGNNFSSSKNKQPKHIKTSLMELVKLIGEEHSLLNELSLADCHLNANLCILLNSLGVSPGLKKLDICGNDAGNFGARLLAKALQVNSVLEELKLDRNQITYEGYADLTHALKHNSSLLSIPYPVQDASDSLKLNRERTESVLNEMQLLLTRNNKHQSFGDSVEASSWLYETHSKLILTNTEDELYQIASKTTRLLNEHVYDDECVDVDNAQNLLQNVENVKEILDKLVSLGDNGECIVQIADTLRKNLSTEISKNLTESASSMIKYCCDHDLIEKGSSQILETACQQKISELNVEGIVLEFNRLLRQRYGSVQFNMASAVTERVCQELFKALNCVNSLLSKAKKSSANAHSNERTCSLSSTPNGKKKFKFFNKRPLSIVEGIPGNFNDIGDDRSSDDLRGSLDISIENFDSNSVELMSKESISTSPENSPWQKSTVLVTDSMKTCTSSLIHVQKTRAKPPANRKSSKSHRNLYYPSTTKGPVKEVVNVLHPVDEGVERFFDQNSQPANPKIQNTTFENFTCNAIESIPKRAQSLLAQEPNGLSIEQKRNSKLPAGIPLFSTELLNELGTKGLFQQMVCKPKVSEPSITLLTSSRSPPTISLTPNDLSPILLNDKKGKSNSCIVEQSSAAGACCPSSDFLATDLLALIDSKFGGVGASSTPNNEKNKKPTITSIDSWNTKDSETKHDRQLISSVFQDYTDGLTLQNLNSASSMDCQPSVTPVIIRHSSLKVKSDDPNIKVEMACGDAMNPTGTSLQSLSPFDEKRIIQTPDQRVITNISELSSTPHEDDSHQCLNPSSITSKAHNLKIDDTMKIILDKSSEKPDFKPPLPSRPPPPRPVNRFRPPSRDNTDESFSPVLAIQLREKHGSAESDISSAEMDKRKSVFEMRRVFELSNQQHEVGSQSQDTHTRPAPPPRHRMATKTSPLSE